MVNALYACANVTRGFSPSAYTAYTEACWDVVLKVSLLIKIYFYVCGCVPGYMNVHPMYNGWKKEWDF